MAIFHGVYSTGRPKEGSKYSYVADLLYEGGCSVMVMESSRRPIRGDFNQKSLIASFTGKSFDAEVDDCRNCLQAALDEAESSSLTLWGFSLGGIIAALLTVEHPGCGVVTSGTGVTPRPESADMLSLPILRHLRPDDLVAFVRRARPSWVLSFWGSEDRVFPREGAREAYEVFATDQRQFIEYPGADHSFRHVKGKSSFAALDLMAQTVLNKVKANQRP